MDLKNNSIFKNMKSLSKDEKTKKSIFTYIIVAIISSILIILNIKIAISVVCALICGLCYFLFAPNPKVRPKKEKKRSSLDEEYLREYDKENNETEV